MSVHETLQHFRLSTIFTLVFLIYFYEPKTLLLRVWKISHLVKQKNNLTSPSVSIWFIISSAIFSCLIFFESLSE